MNFEWIHENPAHWDGQKASIIGSAPAGIFQVGLQRQHVTMAIDETGRGRPQGRGTFNLWFSALHLFFIEVNQVVYAVIAGLFPYDL